MSYSLNDATRCINQKCEIKHALSKIKINTNAISQFHKLKKWTVVGTTVIGVDL